MVTGDGVKSTTLGLITVEVNSILVLIELSGNIADDIVRVENSMSDDMLVVFRIASALEKMVGVGSGVILVGSTTLLLVIIVGIILDVGVMVSTRLDKNTADSLVSAETTEVGDINTLVKSIPRLSVTVGVTVSTTDTVAGVNNDDTISAILEAENDCDVVRVILIVLDIPLVTGITLLTSEELMKTVEVNNTLLSSEVLKFADVTTKLEVAV